MLSNIKKNAQPGVMPLVYEADKPRVQNQTIETAAGVDSY